MFKPRNVDRLTKRVLSILHLCFTICLGIVSEILYREIFNFEKRG